MGTLVEGPTKRQKTFQFPRPFAIEPLPPTQGTQASLGIHVAAADRCYPSALESEHILSRGVHDLYTCHVPAMRSIPSTMIHAVAEAIHWLYALSNNGQLSLAQRELALVIITMAPRCIWPESPKTGDEATLAP
eukprot:6484864-Amphidinium_carterae.4